MAKFWMGSTPEACDLCHQPFGNKMIDGKTRFGPWGNMCPSCYKKYGVGLGLGRGQEYERQKNGKWLKVAG